jgi:transposase
MMKTLTKEEILTIPKLKEQGLMDLEIAEKLGCSPGTVAYWKRRLREAGHTMAKVSPKGRAKLEL